MLITLRNIVTALALILTAISGLQSTPQLQQPQSRDQQLYRTAQTYINLNRYQNAARILQDLVRRHPDNLPYYQSLFNTLIVLNRGKEADSLAATMQKRQPDNPRFTIDRATVAYLQNRKEQAMELWNRTIARHPGDAAVYIQVANGMLRNRLLEEPIAVYKKAIRQIKEAYYLYQNIATLYQQRLMYAEAARYFVKYLEHTPPQEKYVSSRILSFEIAEEDRNQFASELKKIARSSAIRPKVLLILAKYYQKYRQFDDALQIYLELEQESRDGRFLLQFARAAQRDSSFEIALRTYRMILKDPEKIKNLFQVYAGTVNTLFSLARKNVDSKKADEAIRLIREAESRFKNQPGISQLLYEEAKFYLEYYFDLDAAIRTFEKIIRTTPRTNRIHALAQLQESRCRIIRGDLPAALKILYRIQLPALQGEVLLEKARVHFFLKNWKTAGELLDQLFTTIGPKDAAANDALDLQGRLAFAGQDSLAAVKIADAELLMFQKKKSEAAEKMADLLASGVLPPHLSSRLYQERTHLLLELNEPEQALETCTLAIQDSSLIQYADTHLFSAATILERRFNKPGEAFTLYQKLLQNYPASLFADDCRQRMKTIREQYPEDLP